MLWELNGIYIYIACNSDWNAENIGFSILLWFGHPQYYSIIERILSIIYNNIGTMQKKSKHIVDKDHCLDCKIYIEKKTTVDEIWVKI